MRSTRVLFIGTLLWALCLAPGLSAKPAFQYGYRQPYSAATIPAGTTINVRTNQSINAKDSNGQVFSGYVDEDVRDRRGNIAIPRGSDVELVVRKLSRTDLALDMDSVMVNGQRYGIETQENVVEAGQDQGLGANKRTGKYVGGGAVLGAIIGAIAGGGKGAAIGAGAGAAAGAGAQVLTRGRSIDVPAESLLTFRLEQPMRLGIADQGYMRDGTHYHRYQGDSRYDDRARLKPGYYGNGQGTVTIGSDNNITWQGPQNARVYVQVDNNPAQLFAAGPSGTQLAPWIAPGHVFLFTLQDGNGNEIARDQLDLRSRRR
jgi:hypothetical protein